MLKAAMAAILKGLPFTEDDDRLKEAAGLAQAMAAETSSTEPDEQSYSREDIAKAADLVMKLYGEDAVAWAERYAPPGKELFARLVLREIKSRMAK